MIPTREELVAIVSKVLRSLFDVARITNDYRRLAVGIRFRPERGVSVVTGAVDTIVPEGGWLVREDVSVDDPSLLPSLIETFVNDALRALEARQRPSCVRCRGDLFLLERQPHLDRDWGCCRFCGHTDGYPSGSLS